jgi:hypothetical protein
MNTPPSIAPPSRPSWQAIWKEENALGRSSSGNLPMMFFKPGNDMPEPKPTKNARALNAATPETKPMPPMANASISTPTTTLLRLPSRAIRPS